MPGINYASQYYQNLAGTFQYSLHFGDLFATPNNGRYRPGSGRTIEIPTITTSGRVPADRDSISVAERNYDNAWEQKVLSHQRKWSTFIHPMDIIQTNMAATISNITQTMNNTEKFPEMDAYCISKLYKDWTESGKTADTTVLTAENVLTLFDQYMTAMDEDNVPANGRILYVTPAVKALIRNSDSITRNFDLASSSGSINRGFDRIDEVKIEWVPSKIMKTKFNFSEGFAPAPDSKQINMCLVHPDAVITPISYQFAQVDEPSAISEGKYFYYEESFEDVFILNKRSGAIMFNISA